MVYGLWLTVHGLWEIGSKDLLKFITYQFLISTEKHEVTQSFTEILSCLQALCNSVVL